MGLQEWGFLSFSLAFIGIVSIFSDLGYGTAHLRSLSSNDGNEGIYNKAFLIIKLVQTFITISLILIALFLWVDILHHGFQSILELYTIFLLLPYFFFSQMRIFPYIYFNSRMQTGKMVLPQIIEAVIRNSALIFIGIMYLFKIPGYNLVSATLLFAVIYSISYALFFVSLYLLGRPWNIQKIDKNTFKKTFKSYTKIAYPLALVTVLGTVSGNIDKVLIQFFWAATATGAFASLQKITSPIITFSTAISALFIPLLMRQASKDEVNHDISKYERIISLFILPFVIIFIALRVYIANFWSSYLIPYSEILIFLAMADYLIVINTPYSSGLVARGLTRNIGKITVISICINIFFDLLLIPSNIFGIRVFSLGVVGAAISTFIAFAVETALYRIDIIRTHGSSINYRIFIQIIPAAIQFIYLYGITSYIKIYDIVSFVPVAVSSVVLFFIIAILIKEITFRQLIEFIYSINPFKIREDIKNE